jgi:hypothetical protein
MDTSLSGPSNAESTFPISFVFLRYYLFPNLKCHILFTKSNLIYFYLGMNLYNSFRDNQLFCGGQLYLHRFYSSSRNVNKFENTLFEFFPLAFVLTIKITSCLICTIVINKVFIKKKKKKKKKNKNLAHQIQGLGAFILDLLSSWVDQNFLEFQGHQIVSALKIKRRVTDGQTFSPYISDYRIKSSVTPYSQ